MIKQILNLWDRLRSTYWFVPTLMALSSACLAFGMVALDQRLADSLVRELGWFYTGGADGARQLLSAVASSVITVAGVVFSITIAALTLASSQFGPRLLRNFMRDLGNQVVLGTFISTYVYCLLVLRTIRNGNGEDDPAVVPNLSVTFAVLLAAASLGVLIYFIHHIARSMQASQVIAEVWRDLNGGIDTLFPGQLGGGHSADRAAAREPELPDDFDRGSADVCADADGYLQFVYNDQVMQLAKDCDLVIRLLCRPGDYVMRGRALARVWPASRAPNEQVIRRLRQALSLGSERTPLQDVQFSFDQLVEVAVRAMSPGINDPFTAINCIDRLGSALARLGDREFPLPYRCDDDGRVRVLADPVSFDAVLDATVPPIRHHARRLPSPQVTERLRRVLLDTAELVRHLPRREALRKHASAVGAGDLANLESRQTWLASSSTTGSAS